MSEKKLIVLVVVALLATLLMPSTKAQLATRTEIYSNSQQVPQVTTVNIGEYVYIHQVLYNYFNADWVNWQITYVFIQGQSIASDIDTTAPSSFMNFKGEGGGFELHFRPNATGRIQIEFYYNGTYYEQFPTSEAIAYSSVFPFSIVTIDVHDNSLTLEKIMLPLGIVGIGVAILAFIYHSRRKMSPAGQQTKNVL